MLSTVHQLGFAREYFARAPARGTLTNAADRHHLSRPTAYQVVERVALALGHGGPFDELRRLREAAERREG